MNCEYPEHVEVNFAYSALQTVSEWNQHFPYTFFLERGLAVCSRAAVHSMTCVILMQGMSKWLLWFCIESTTALLIIILEIHLLSSLMSAWLLLLCYQFWSSFFRSDQRELAEIPLLWLIPHSLASLYNTSWWGLVFCWKWYSEPVVCFRAAEQVTICATIAFIY